MTSPAVPPVRLGHLVPERVPVVVQRTNPLWLALAEDDPHRAATPELVDVILHAYVFGPRCPGVIKAELASVEETYQKALGEMGAQIEQARRDGSAVPPGASAFIVAWHTFLRETIGVMVPGLTTGEADVLAAVTPGEDGPGTELLRSLGVWKAEPEAETRPEVPGEEASLSTTAASSPSSPPSTD